MSTEVVLLGSESPKSSTSSESIRLVSPHGDVFVVRAADVTRSELVEPGGELKRLTLSPGAVVHLEIEGTSLAGVDALDGTILKWRDDGGTFSKSRDDT